MIGPHRTMSYIRIDCRVVQWLAVFGGPSYISRNPINVKIPLNGVFILVRVSLRKQRSVSRKRFQNYFSQAISCELNGWHLFVHFREMQRNCERFKRTSTCSLSEKHTHSISFFFSLFSVFFSFRFSIFFFCVKVEFSIIGISHLGMWRRAHNARNYKEIGDNGDDKGGPTSRNREIHLHSKWKALTLFFLLVSLRILRSWATKFIMCSVCCI